MDSSAIYARAIMKESNLDNFRGEERRGTLNHIGKSQTLPKGHVPSGTTKVTYRMGLD